LAKTLLRKSAVKKCFLVLGTALLLFGSMALQPARAVVLDWDTVTWSPNGSLTHSYDIDPTFAGNDITVTISRNTNSLVSGYPQIANDITGGVVPAQNSLRLQLDLNNRNNFVTVTIDFLNPSGVLLPSFSIYDIDTGTGTSPNLTYQDQIRNITASFGTTTYSPTFSNVGSAVTASGGNTLTGNASVANDSSLGNATITFNGGPVTQIVFDYGSGTGSQSNPAQQGVAISDISFNSVSGVPETSTVWTAFGILILASLVRFYHRAGSPLSTKTSVSVE